MGRAVRDGKNSVEGQQTAPQPARKPYWTKTRIILLIILACFVALAVDAFAIEPYDIQITHYDVPANIASPLKIADLSDLHTRGIGRREQELFAALEKEKPDVILITGDTLADPFGNYAACMKVYRRLHAPMGVWFVNGNWENWHPVPRERIFYRRAGVNLLVNQYHELRPDVWVVGLDDPFSGHPNFAQAMKGVPPNVYTILMFHAPGYFDHIAGRVNLVLTGHTHGGQVRIPFVRPWWLPGGSGRFLEGWYEEKGSRMYVSRGLGMSDFPARFDCRPEITFITLEPATEGTH